MNSTSQAKKRMLEELLSEGHNPVVLVDALYDGVVLPVSWLLAGGHLLDNRFCPLTIGLTLPKPIDDLSIDEHGWSGTLAFPHTDFHCVVPWEANRQYNTDDRLVIWLLPELEPTESPTKNTKSPYKRPSHLRIVK